MLLSDAIQHRNFDRASKRAKVIVTHGPKDALIFVVGPSGAGKSTLRKHLCTALYGPPSKWPTNRVPLLTTQATNSEAGYFSSKDFYSRALMGLGDPFRGGLAEALSLVEGRDSDLLQFLTDPLWRSIRVSMTEMSIRRAFEKLASILGLESFLIDEAQGMCLTHRHRSPSDHLESLKCLAAQIPMQIFLMGTYDLLDVWNHSSQLNRRIQLIHLARYDDTIPGDRDAFFSVLKMLGRSIALEDFAMFSRHAEEILHWTFGVFGEAEALLQRAQIAAFAEGREAVAWTHIREAAYTPAQLKRLADEIVKGEAKIQGIVKAAKPGSREAPAQQSAGHRPGRRNPVRDQCGTDA